MVIYTHGLVPQQGSADMFARAFEIVRPCGAIKYSSLPSPDLNYYIVGSSIFSSLMFAHRPTRGNLLVT